MMNDPVLQLDKKDVASGLKLISETHVMMAGPSIAKSSGQYSVKNYRQLRDEENLTVVPNDLLKILDSNNVLSPKPDVTQSSIY